MVQLRAVAVLGVFLYHLHAAAMPGGFVGVDVFFVISGYLITHLLIIEIEKSGSINLKSFFYRRVLRIFPAYYTYILAGVALAYFGVVEVLPGDVLHASSYMMNYHVERGWHFNHTWSLAVEEQFYLVWPLALLALGRRHALFLLVLMIFAVPCVRTVMWMIFDSEES